MSRASSLGSSHPASRQASINAPAIEQRFASSSIEHSDPVDQGFYKGDREYLLTSTQVHGTYRSYMFISVLRWILLLTLAFSLCLPRFNIVNSYYAGRVDVCGACLFNAKADPGNYYEWSTCGALNVTEFRVAKDANLLRYIPDNISFKLSSDLNQIIPVCIFFYSMSLLLLAFYGAYMCVWHKKSDDAESSMAGYITQSAGLNIILALCTSYMTMFSFSLALKDGCYIQSFPRSFSYIVAIAVFMILTLAMTLLLSVLVACCSCCNETGHCSFRHVMVILILICFVFASCGVFLANLIISGHGGGATPAIIGILCLAFSVEIPAYAVWTGRGKYLNFGADEAALSHQ